jgi:cbb3-type cytochrome oxidase maturation protein
MSVVIILMLASLAVGLVFVGAFIWSVRSGQYEDTLTPSMRVLMDDATTQPQPTVITAGLLPLAAETATVAAPTNAKVNSTPKSADL